MDTCNLFCQSFSHINWMWFAVSVVVTFGLGVMWYSALFAKAWIRVFKVEIPEKVTAGSFVRTMLIQFCANLLFGVVFFILTELSVWVAAWTLVGFCAWEKGFLNFQFAKMKDFIMASFIRAGYTFLVGIIFILFALIG